MWNDFCITLRNIGLCWTCLTHFVHCRMFFNVSSVNLKENKRKIKNHTQIIFIRLSEYRAVGLKSCWTSDRIIQAINQGATTSPHCLTNQMHVL